MIDDNLQPADSLIDPSKPKDSSVIIDALIHAEKEFRDYNEMCRRIDAIYSAKVTLSTTISELGMSDQEYDTFWASMEVLKPAIYAKAPQVIAKPRFSDATATDKVVAELIERVVNSEFERGGIDMHLREVRDDMALLNRGVLWVTYEAKGGRKSICVDHVDRLDYRHEPVRYWPELGWEARCAWMTERQMRDRFTKLDLGTIKRAGFVTRTSEGRDQEPDDSAKAPVWEVWSKADNRVYWVTEGVDTILDDGPPHLDLRDFFPGPRPAYGTLRRRTLIPVPDYIRYERHLDQINVLTSRIYTLLDQVKRKVLIPGGGDVSEAVQLAYQATDDAIFIPVPGGGLTASGSQLAYELPLDQLANAITGLITARTQLFADFDRLSGISDIMRGETEADETLGAQRIKTQYGSVRVKDKTEEIVRLARDAARVSVEIICDKFDQKTLLEISQMTIPTRREVEKDVDAIKQAAKKELEALGNKATEAAQHARQQGQQADPAQAQQMLQQAQQQIAEKYAPELQRLANTVVIEDVMAVIKDKRDRGLIIDIETDSTVMVDEIAEKQAANELVQAVSNSIAALMPLFQFGEVGVKAAVSIIETAVTPYLRNNRKLRTVFDELIENAPEIAAKMAAQNSDGDAEGLAEANKALAAAEQKKADAAMANVQAKAALDQANSQLKFAQLQQQAADNERKHENEINKLRLSAADAATKAEQAQAKQQAEIDNLTAQTAKILASIGLDERKQQLSEYQAAEQAQNTRVDQAMAAQGQQSDADFRDREAGRADRGEDRADRQQDFSERSGDRQMSLAERQAEQGER